MARLPGNEFGPQDSLVFLDFQDQYTENGVRVVRNKGLYGRRAMPLYGPNLVPDGNMEMAGVANWLDYNGQNRSKSATDPVSGTQCLLVGNYLGGVAHRGTESTAVLVNGATYRISGYAQSDGIMIPTIFFQTADFTTPAWSGTTSTAWQPFDFTTAVNGTKLGFYIYQAGSYFRLDDISVQQPLSTVQCILGDGTTSSTFPSQLVGRRGVAMGNTKRIDCAFDPIGVNDFTVAIQMSNLTIGGGFPNFFSNGTTLLYSFANNFIYSPNNGGTVLYFSPVGFDTGYATGTVIVTRAANDISCYWNGKQLGVTASTVARAAGTGTLKFGSNVSGGGNIVTGNFHHNSVWPWAMCSTQVAALDRMIRRGINLP